MTAFRVGNAPCSWGVINFHEGGATAAGYATVLDEIRETGYAGTELGDLGFMPTDPQVLREELARRELAMIGSFVAVALREPSAHAGGVEFALQVARLLASVADPAGVPPVIVLSDDCGREPVRTRHAGRVTPEMGLSETEWRVFARGADQIALAVREETGLRTVFHPHCAGFVETPDEIASLMERTDPALLGLALDTGHWSYGAGRNDPGVVLDLLERFPDRIWHVHFKDCQPDVANEARAAEREYNEAIGRGVFCELGQGLVDFPAVKTWLEGRGYDGWIVVEQDVLPGLGSPKESARRNREYLRSTGL
jgi:inosose dehydratase